MNKYSNNNILIKMFSKLAYEILYYICNNLEPQDIRNLAQVFPCITEIENDQYFWRNKYLSLYEPPEDYEPENWIDEYIYGRLLIVTCNKNGELYAEQLKTRPMYIIFAYFTQNNEFLIDKDNYLWVKGNNLYGQSGLGKYNNTKEFTKIPDICAKSIDGSYNFTIIIDIDNSVYSMGDNELGQLGLGDYRSRYIPTKIENIKAVKVSCYNYSVLLLTPNNDVYIFGYNNRRLYVEFANIIKTPTIIPDIKAIDIWNGFCALFIDKHNKIIAMGKHAHLVYTNVRTLNNAQKIFVHGDIFAIYYTGPKLYLYSKYDKRSLFKINSFNLSIKNMTDNYYGQLLLDDNNNLYRYFLHDISKLNIKANFIVQNTPVIIGHILKKEKYQ